MADSTRAITRSTPITISHLGGSPGSSAPCDCEAPPSSVFFSSLSLLDRVTQSCSKMQKNVACWKQKLLRDRAGLSGWSFWGQIWPIWPFFMVGLEIFENLLSSWPFFNFIKVYLLKSKIWLLLNKTKFGLFQLQAPGNPVTESFMLNSLPFEKACGTKRKVYLQAELGTFGIFEFFQ